MAIVRLLDSGPRRDGSGHERRGRPAFGGTPRRSGARPAAIEATTGGDRRARTLATLTGAMLLGERAMLGDYRIPGRVSAGGGCRLYDTRDGGVALALSRSDDRELLPALFAVEAVDDGDLAALFARCGTHAIVARGRLLGLAIAAVEEAQAPGPAVTLLTPAPPAAPTHRAPRVLDLSALWAGPLAAHLLGLAGATVVRVESRVRPAPARIGEAAFEALLAQGTARVPLDLRSPDGRAALIALVVRSDIVIEAARPRALRQLGIDADALVRATPGLTWLTITGHGATGAAADRVGFGDDCGVAAGLTAALRHASGRAGFVGDAIADPLTGIRAAGVAWAAWSSGRGGRHGVAMTGVVAEAIAAARAHDAAGFDAALVAWADAAGERFPPASPCAKAPAPC